MPNNTYQHGVNFGMEAKSNLDQGGHFEEGLFPPPEDARKYIDSGESPTFWMGYLSVVGELEDEDDKS